MIGKRRKIAGLLSRMGTSALLDRLPKHRCLVALNYHRIGDPEQQLLDRGVFSAVADRFAFQMEWLKAHFPVVSLEEAQDFVDHPERLRRACVLITFDDGYRDGYQVAFPVLKALGLPATYFLATGFVGGRRMPWWDCVPDLLRRANLDSIHLQYPRPVKISGDLQSISRQVLKLYKDPGTTDPARFLRELEQGCGATIRDEAPDRLFLDWAEAREMIDAGMSIGSHSHSHELLSRRSREEQREDLQRSRSTLRAELGIAADAFAYPVGSAGSFSEATRAVLAEVGYRTAFSYYGGINLPGRIDRYNVRRIGVGNDLSDEHFALRTQLLAVAGRQLF